ncbi:sufE-like protein 2, chloroplastic [Eucalyptus grandis]|uniref:sufE-like protein 2, chloroplastic n=1 Tax=Eucalyptus grandis TaxID=71139 RepID=UPI00192F03A5|nr:sufE-like protein 2, chloroplastic [Eucalyptus grandis]
MNLASSPPPCAPFSLRFPPARPPGPRWRRARPPAGREIIGSRLAATSALGLDCDVSGSAHHSRPLPGATPDRLRRLASEFQSLAEPIDRVKRLLHYAAILPPFDESARHDANRVAGCATRVWLEVGTYGSPPAAAAAGFCSCLIWALDEAEPEEVIAVRAEDLAAVNVGLVAHSRANTWQNVLTSMQRRTEALLKERSAEPDHRCNSPYDTRCPCQQEA